MKKPAILLTLTAASLLAQSPRGVTVTGPRRLALVAGNAAYQSQPLRNPVHDAQSLRQALQDGGFEVTTALNADLRSLDRAIAAFVSGIHPGDVALFFYSGHGVQVDGENYLVPVDFRAQQEADIPYQAYPASRVLDKIQAAGASLTILILDACRDNPFRATTRSGTKGLAAMTTGKGSFIAFATAPGATASDNPTEANGLFTRHLLDVLTEPGLKLGDIFDRVRERVYTASAGKQLPWTASSVIGSFVFRDAAEEIARMESQLKDYDSQIADAARRKAVKEQSDLENAAASLRARLRDQPPAAAQSQANGDTEQVRIEELRRKRDQRAKELAALNRQSITLDEARRQLESLEKQLVVIGAEADAARDSALRQLPPELAAQKGPFETTAEYLARRDKAHAAQADVTRRYAAEFDTAAAPFRRRTDDLRSRTFPMDRVRIEFSAYDADQSRLTAKIDGEEYLFKVIPQKARSLYDQASLVRVEKTLEGTSLALLDPATGEKFLSTGFGGKINPKDGQKYVWVPPGSFNMGCSPGDSECIANEGPAHKVTISKGFWLGQTEVTQAAWQKVRGSNPSSFKGPNRPVEQVKLNEAATYCARIGGRLPTEAEWEYAARGGSAQSRYGQLEQVAWYSPISNNTTYEVARKEPNAFGLYDMLGNVWEWVADWYGEYPAGSVTDPTGPSSGTEPILRGGAWNYDSRVARASFRFRYVPVSRYVYIGLRCVWN
jgi:formylglycine-generating enzyme required for sulfatase activity/uncharacterized caspase-like protein